MNERQSYAEISATQKRSIKQKETAESLAAALKDLQHLEAPQAKKKEKDPPAEAVAKAVTVSISTDAKI